MKKVLIIWLWNQWKKYLNYFFKNGYIVNWICKTIITKQKFETKYKIKVFQENDNMNYSNYDIIITALPPEIQWKKALEILKNWYENQIIIEIPVTWDEKELEELKKYNNVKIFLEEYYTLLAKFLRKIDIKKIKKIDIDVYTNKIDYENEKAKKVTLLHIESNFLWLNINKNIISYEFHFHEREDIFYEISFIYENKKVKYIFSNEKKLIVWDKNFKDDFCFDKVLKLIIKEKDNFSKLYYIDA